jgi:hypothetical protein
MNSKLGYNLKIGYLTSQMYFLRRFFDYENFLIGIIQCIYGIQFAHKKI